MRPNTCLCRPVFRLGLPGTGHQTSARRTTLARPHNVFLVYTCLPPAQLGVPDPFCVVGSVKADLDPTAPQFLRSCLQPRKSHATCNFWGKGLFCLLPWALGKRRLNTGDRSQPAGTLRREEEAGWKVRPESWEVSGSPAWCFPVLYNQLSLQHIPAWGFASPD